MKIWVTTSKLKQMEIDIEAGCLIELSGPVAGRRRGPTDLIAPCGWVSQDYDEGGLVTALKIVEGDAFGRSVLSIAQVSPKVQDPYQNHTDQSQVEPSGE
jgi:hypothetical protein